MLSVIHFSGAVLAVFKSRPVPPSLVRGFCIPESTAGQSLSNSGNINNRTVHHQSQSWPLASLCLWNLASESIIPCTIQPWFLLPLPRQSLGFHSCEPLTSSAPPSKAHLSVQAQVCTMRFTQAVVAVATPRFSMYFDQRHMANLPGKEITAGTTHAPGTPFKPLGQVRAIFDSEANMSMAIGGWGDTAGFRAAVANEQTRKTYAKNIAEAVRRLGYDGVDIDWEYPGGNGEDYKRIPNNQKVGEIAAFPELMYDIKAALGPDKELSAAIPGKEIDMIAFTPENIKNLNKCVDYFHVMTYDLMNRRDTVTTHQSSVRGSAKTIDTYLERGMEPSKMGLSFPFYAKFFETKGPCNQPIGCPTVLLEAADGSDTQKSGALTFEPENTSKAEFVEVMKDAKEDATEGGQWYWDPKTSKFWTWDEPKQISQKMDIVTSKKLAGVFAWSLAEESSDWRHLKAIQAGVKGLTA